MTRRKLWIEEGVGKCRITTFEIRHNESTFVIVKRTYDKEDVVFKLDSHLK